MGLERKEKNEKRCNLEIFSRFRLSRKFSPGQTCVCACLCAIGGGRGPSWLFERWNINATLPLIFLHLSPTCPLRAPLSPSMNRHSLDINRQLVGSLFFKGKHTRTPLAPFFVPFRSSPLFFFFHSEKKPLIFNSPSRQSHSEAFHPQQFNAQTETSGTFIGSASGSATCLSPLAAGHSPLFFYFFFRSVQFNAIFKLLDFEHEEPG